MGKIGPLPLIADILSKTSGSRFVSSNMLLPVTLGYSLSPRCIPFLIGEKVRSAALSDVLANAGMRDAGSIPPLIGGQICMEFVQVIIWDVEHVLEFVAGPSFKPFKRDLLCPDLRPLPSTKHEPQVGEIER